MYDGSDTVYLVVHFSDLVVIQFTPVGVVYWLCSVLFGIEEFVWCGTSPPCCNLEVLNSKSTL